MHGYATPVRIPPLRTLKRSPATTAWGGRRSPTSRAISRATGQQHDRPGRPAQRTEGPDAAPDPELRRRQQPLRLLPARHRGRRRPEPLHAVGQPPLRDLQQDRPAARRARTRATRSSTGTPYCGDATAATRSCSTTSSRAAGWRPSSRSTARAGRSTSASRSRPRTTRPAPGARTSSSSTRSSSTTTRSSASGRRRTRTR